MKPAMGARKIERQSVGGMAGLTNEYQASTKPFTYEQKKEPSTIKTASANKNDDDMEEEIPEDDDYEDDFDDKPKPKA